MAMTFSSKYLKAELYDYLYKSGLSSWIEHCKFSVEKMENHWPSEWTYIFTKTPLSPAVFHMETKHADREGDTGLSVPET